MVNQPRHVIRSQVIGVMIRKAPNVKMYIVSVLWSDDSEVIIYRSFQEFQKFHGHLKKRFPLLNPLKKSERVIPKFKARAIKSKLQQNGSRKSVHRMNFLHDYCSELLNCDPCVCQSSEVTRFFTCKDHDLQPDFTKNSVMVLPSGDLSKWKGRGEADGDGRYPVSVTSPLMTQTYSCVAAYQTKDTKNRPFNVVHNEVLEVLIKDPAGWWLVENQHKRLAWFPAPYLQMSEEDGHDDDDDQRHHQDTTDSPLEGGAMYLAVRSYAGQKPDEVSVPIGSVVHVLRTSKDGWWLVRYNGQAGFVPAMYLKPYSNPKACLHTLQRKLYSSTLNLASLEPAAGGRLPSLSEQREGDTASRLHKARSLDVLSEAGTPAAAKGPRGFRSISLDDDYAAASALGGRRAPPRRERGYSTTSVASSAESRLSYRSTSTSASSSGGGSSHWSGSAQGSPVVMPAVPPRPRAQEILSRCTTMTRKAALASRDRLLPERDIHIQSR